MSYLLYTGFAAAVTSILLQYDIYYKLNLENMKNNNLKLICHGSADDFVRKLNGNFVSIFKIK